jgi:hypothetical protein
MASPRTTAMVSPRSQAWSPRPETASPKRRCTRASSLTVSPAAVNTDTEARSPEAARYRQARMRPTGSGCSIRGSAGPTGSPSATAASSAVTTVVGSTSAPGSASTPTTAACRPAGAAAAEPGSGCAAGGGLRRSIRNTCPRRGPTVALAVTPSHRRA